MQPRCVSRTCWRNPAKKAGVRAQLTTGDANFDLYNRGKNVGRACAIRNRLESLRVHDLSATLRPAAQGFRSLIAAISVTSGRRCENEIRKSDTRFTVIHKKTGVSRFGRKSYFEEGTSACYHLCCKEIAFSANLYELEIPVTDIKNKNFIKRSVTYHYIIITIIFDSISKFF